MLSSQALLALHVNAIFRLLFICAVMALSGSRASAQLSYDGYVPVRYEIYFEYAGERDGNFGLLFMVTDDLGQIRREWIRLEGSFLGFRVSFEKQGTAQTAVFRSPVPFETAVSGGYIIRPAGIRIPLYGRKSLSVGCGTLGLAGRVETAVAYVGDSFQLGDTTATVLSLSAVYAVVQLSGSSRPTTLPLSTIGELRFEHSKLQREVYRLQLEQWEGKSIRELSLLLQEGSIFLLGAYLVVYAFIFIGWITRDKHLDGHKPRKRNG